MSLQRDEWRRFTGGINLDWFKEKCSRGNRIGTKVVRHGVSTGVLPNSSSVRISPGGGNIFLSRFQTRLRARVFFPFFFPSPALLNHFLWSPGQRWKICQNWAGSSLNLPKSRSNVTVGTPPLVLSSLRARLPEDTTSWNEILTVARDRS